MFGLEQEHKSLMFSFPRLSVADEMCQQWLQGKQYDTLSHCESPYSYYN